MSEKKSVVITSAVRTAIGSLGGTLKNIPAYKLGSSVISSAIKKSNLKPSEIDEVIMGHVLTGGAGQHPGAVPWNHRHQISKPSNSGLLTIGMVLCRLLINHECLKTEQPIIYDSKS